MSDSPFMDVPEVAAILERSVPRIYQLIQEGEIPAARIGHRLVIPRDAWAHWLADKNAVALKRVKRVKWWGDSPQAFYELERYG